MKKLFFIFVFTLVACFAQAQEVKNIGEPQRDRLHAFKFKYTSWDIIFTDGTKGILCQDQSDNNYFVDKGQTRAYYKSREAAIKAAYYSVKEGILINEGKYTCGSH